MTTIDLSDQPAARRRWIAPLAWTGAVFAYAIALGHQATMPAWIAIRESAIYLYLLALLMIPVSRISRRWMARDGMTKDLLWRHALLGAVVITIWRGAIVLEDWMAVGPRFWDLIYSHNWMFIFLFDVAVYGAAAGLTLTSQALARDRERERREAELVLAAREAELGAIRAQFQPHFVLNALNSLLALIDQEPALARTMVVRLSDLMKAVFERVDLPAVPLERELDLVRAYLDVERIRFGSRMSVTFEIEDAARGVLVPPFLLQPLAENAVKHGIAPFARQGAIRVTARLEGPRLVVTVTDSAGGPSGTLSGGTAPPSTALLVNASTGRGLNLTRRRLESVYGSGYELTLERQPGGTEVRVSVPAGTPHAA